MKGYENFASENGGKPRARGVLSWVGLLLVLFAGSIAEVRGFSAKLTRPWEASQGQDRLITTKGNRFYRIRELASRARLLPSKSSSPQPASSTAITASADDNDGTSKDEGDSEISPASLSSSELFLASSADGSDASQTLDTRSKVNGAAYEPAPGVWSSRGTLFQLTRPSNFPGVVFLHLLGGYLSLSYSGQGDLFKRILFQTPTMWVVLAALLLTSSTSMVVNDYYDSKLGRDTEKENSPLVSGTLTLGIVRKFLNYLYAVALICVAIVPGVPARIACVMGLMLTFWYTKHLKPMTWIKNVMCASLIALSPFTSGSAALKVASEIGGGAWGNLRVLAVPDLWRLVAFLFFGVCGREVMMDITDLKDDKLNCVRTIPVKYGRRFASAVAMVCYLLGGLWVIGGPATQLGAALGETVSASALKTVLMANQGLARRLVFGGIGSLMLARRGIQVFQTKGEDQSVVDKTVDEAQLAMIVSLVSFI